jgi:L,D-peptidoglycan transpeptidase YkuD (ErfK/YbiS/YcfS/YnhG family)
MHKRSMLIVRALSAGRTRGWLGVGTLCFPCALGRSGRRSRKSEGDGASPRGSFRLVEVLYRADRVRRPAGGMRVSAIVAGDGWCDDRRDRNYNRAVRLPYPASHERMWRDDHLYDVVVVLDHNRRPRVRGAGSAIFMHVARSGYTPTEGCIALARPHLLRVLALAGRNARLVIT